MCTYTYFGGGSEAEEVSDVGVGTTLTQPSRVSPARLIRDERVRVWRSLLELHGLVIDDLERTFRDRHTLSVSEFDVLVNIGPHESIRHGELSGRVVLTRTALTRLIDRLVSRGWLTRSVASDDQRGITIALTDAGRRVRQEAARTNLAVVHEHLGLLDAEELSTLGEITTAVLQRHCTKEDSS